MFGAENVTVSVSARVDFGEAESAPIVRGTSAADVHMVSLSTAGVRAPEGVRRPSLLDAVRGLSVAVFINRALFGGKPMQDDLKAAVIDSIRTVTRLDERRGDKISVVSVPFNKARRTGPRRTGTGDVATRARVRRNGACGWRHVGLRGWALAALALFGLLGLVVRSRRARTRRMAEDALALSGAFNISVERESFAYDDDFDDPEYRRELVRGTAEREPEVMAKILRTIWLDDDRS